MWQLLNHRPDQSRKQSSTDHHSKQNEKESRGGTFGLPSRLPI